MAAAYGLKPDLVCLGEYVGGGLPIAAVALRRDLAECFAPATGRGWATAGPSTATR